jgi:hypothetical protein
MAPGSARQFPVPAASLVRTLFLDKRGVRSRLSVTLKSHAFKKKEWATCGDQVKRDFGYKGSKQKRANLARVAMAPI